MGILHQLWSAPTPIDIAENKCVVVGINNSGNLAFCKLGDTLWSIFEGGQEGIYYLTLAFKDGKLCRLGYSGELLVCHSYVAIQKP